MYAAWTRWELITPEPRAPVRQGEPHNLGTTFRAPLAPDGELYIMDLLEAIAQAPKAEN
jgi:hypothetical protein